MPSVFRKDNKKKNLIYQLPVIFSKIQLQYNISPGDFPDCAKMQVSLLCKRSTPHLPADSRRRFSLRRSN